ncbi:hypothetical protein JG688_00000605 [Phytophthora aleatoria]|uniref:Uncharacterized protein n=1 Tax=Phytophthora aleatoria TaxID=2496075 RepID=A0A8J5IYS6_9STRA|nr:hypothetical protein JG688_00000605 [Phytophthora aleatoria]
MAVEGLGDLAREDWENRIPPARITIGVFGRIDAGTHDPTGGTACCRVPRRERSLPRRELPVHGSNSKRSRRSPSPRRDSEEDLGNLPLFDEVNMSCSDDEDDYSCPSLQASPSPSETGVERSPESALSEDGFSFPLASTGDASRTHRLLDWAFGDNA